MAESDQPMGVFENFDEVKPKVSEEILKEKKANLEKEMANELSKRNAFLHDLAGEGGEIVKTVLNNLADRIQFLIDQDPECMAYKKVLGNIYEKIQFPKKVSRKLAKVFEIEGAPKF